jgi:hypothetical protein
MGILKLMIVQIQCCLEEKKSLTSRVIHFAGANYRDVWKDILNLIQEVDGDEYHGAKLKTMLRLWADDGRLVMEL